jgi:hypothetical protein
MMKTKKILEFCGILDNDEEVESEDPNNRDLFEAELTEIFKEMSSQHSDTREFTVIANNLKTVAEAYQTYERAVTEKDRIAVEMDKNDKLVKQKFIENIPRGVGLIVSGALTFGWVLVEQGHPVANRLINKTNDCLTRP